MRILKLTEDTRKDILQNLLKRSPNNYGEFEGRVNAIIEEVRNNRDQAVFNYTKQFDGADINAGNILVTEEEIAEAYEQVDTTLLAVIRKSLVNIKKYHEKQVQKIFKKLYDQGDIYKGHYEGMYCTPCESFFTESQLVDGKCPDCGRPCTPAKEEAYFFKF